MSLWIGLGGIAGAVSRYSIGIWLGKKGGTFPWATFLVNMAGSFLLGLLAGSADRLPEATYTLLGTGFCGAFTTFSTFGYEAVTLAGQKLYMKAFTYVMMSVMLGILAAWIGYAASAPAPMPT
ncbi:fluoride efflux transporter CrcB [Paenibacillus dakarensis]|uniref:fluoride efflux transporter CrcB n=1 Tax=Paenibacillus dakarensis TaxID=1527293 RepID=UPI0006D5A007|nr:fluoride efflux transporter CrcB [Paenibacillus dakarensis]